MEYRKVELYPNGFGALITANENGNGNFDVTIIRKTKKGYFVTQDETFIKRDLNFEQVIKFRWIIQENIWTMHGPYILVEHETVI